MPIHPEGGIMGLPLMILDITGSPITFYLINAVIIVVLLLVSALISGAEVAFFSISADELDNLRKEPGPDDRRIVKFLARPKRLLATILIVNNLVNVGMVTLSALVTWEIVDSKDPASIAIIVLTVGMTFIIVLFGEILPKIYANQNSVKFAKAAAPLISVSEYIFWPLAWVLVHSSGLVERRFTRKGYRLSVDDLNHALEITAGHETTKEEKEILKGIVNFGTISVRQIMRPRMEMTAFEVDIDFHDLMDKINKNGFSRVPVYRDTMDKIEGVLYAKDLLPYISEDENFEWQKLLRNGYFVPESKKIDDLLKDFQEKRVHMAIVVDEYGGTSGLVTMEDIIEEIVGEINDEFDQVETQTYVQTSEHSYIFEGRTLIVDFSEVLDINADTWEDMKGESESLGGLLLEVFSRMPKIGEKMSISGVDLTIISVDLKRIRKVKVEDRRHEMAGEMDENEK